MKDIIYVTGHKNPDSDSICAAYSYAEFKNLTGDTKAVPVRLGNVSQETQFVLDYFGAKAPELLKTVRLMVEDLNFDKINPVLPTLSLKSAWNVMKENNMKTLPVADENNHLLGVLSVSNLTSCYMDMWDNTILSKSNTTLENILDTLSATACYINENLKTFPGKIVVSAMDPKSMVDHINDGDIAIVGDREEAQVALIDKKVSLMIVTGSHTPCENIITLARENGVTVIVTPHDSFTTSRLIVQSVPVEYVMAKENIVSFTNDDLVDDIKDAMAQTRFRSYPVTDENGRVLGMVARYHLISNHKKKVIQVDHNERGQSIPGVEEADILEIVDHHRVADIQTVGPLLFRGEPLGSTATIVTKIFDELDVEMPSHIAGLLLGAVVSDTLLFKSPTCTPVDTKIAKKLAEIAGVDIQEFAMEMFKAGTSLVGKTVDEIFNQDFKKFSFDNLQVGVAQVNSMDIEGFLPYKKDMLDYMNKFAEDNNLEFTLLLLTDIINANSEIFVGGPRPELVEKAFNVQLTECQGTLAGVISRKKQVVPAITAVMSE